MRPSLDNLPFDVLFNIGQYLDVDDVINLSRVSRQIYSAFGADVFCRNVTQFRIPWAQESQLAKKHIITHRKALNRIFERRQAFGLARPFSACLLGYGRSFIYNEGFMCYLTGRSIRILDVHGWAKDEAVVDVDQFLDHVTKVRSNQRRGRLTLLHYSDRQLACLYDESRPLSRAWIIALDVRITRSTQEQNQIRAVIELAASTKLFARINADFLCYGTHDGINNDGHREWIVHCHRFDAGEACSAGDGIRLANFAGADLGLTCTFELYNGYFYAVSTQTRFEVEEVDWTSYYHGIRFPLDNPTYRPLEENNRIYRRQHIEGPVNDSWSSISLQRDDSTGELLIIECRREWFGGGSRNMRTWYTVPVKGNFPRDKTYSPYESRSPAETESAHIHLPDDVLVQTLDEYSKPNYEPTRDRLARHFHPEYSEREAQPRNFILTKTKYRTYNHASSAFLDFVDDPLPTSNAWVSRPRLRLRIGCRRLMSPLNDDGSLRKPKSDSAGRPIEYSEERFQNKGIHMWPPDSSPDCLLRFLYPTVLTTVPAASDERAFIYMSGSCSCENDLLSGERAIILIGFDPAIALGYRKIEWQFGDKEDAEKVKKFIVDDKICHQEMAVSSSTRGHDKSSTQAHLHWFRTDKAMHLQLHEGYRFKYTQAK
ncbi:MAG: hypothetical protein M1834_002180 [Cirrosporium novae-zelandiae]|nr:MAG: hypothetical protein M1834_002180 [Cirrosporium novae-zelandiae]